MNRYVMRFTKQGNMKYISHLDLHRLFKRSLKKAGIAVDYSKGYNPHEMINVVQPLSLGFESDSEYFELETPMELDKEGAVRELNEFLPEGMSFTAIRRIAHQKSNLSACSEYASYEIKVPDDAGLLSPSSAEAFISQPQVNILKRDKKTKQQVEKNVKSMIRSFSCEREGGVCVINCVLRCASNETLNPMNLTESFLRYAGLETDRSLISVRRLEIFGLKESLLIPLLELYPDEDERSFDGEKA
ncbi:MAG: DUF2344 domain-containing protein [Firmicutes bacterium]|nr:DUF2344 domain-containing protein [Bacillota bacterium]